MIIPRDNPSNMIDALLHLVSPKCDKCDKPATKQQTIKGTFQTQPMSMRCDDHCPSGNEYEDLKQAAILRRAENYLKTVEMKT